MPSPYTVPHASYQTSSATFSIYSSTDSNSDRADVLSALLDVGTSSRLAPVALGRSRSHLEA